MRFRIGVIIGFGTGYVLGARAGRERYEQIMALWERVRGDDRIDAVIGKAASLTEAQRRRAQQAIGDQLRAAGSAIRHTDTTG